MAVCLADLNRTRACWPGRGSRRWEGHGGRRLRTGRQRCFAGGSEAGCWRRPRHVLFTQRRWDVSPRGGAADAEPLPPPASAHGAAVFCGDRAEWQDHGQLHALGPWARGHLSVTLEGISCGPRPAACALLPRCAPGLLAAQKTSGLQGRWHEHGAVPLARWLALSGPVWVSARTACTPPCQGFYSAVGGVLGGLVAGPAGGLPGCKVAAERAGPGRSRCPQKQPIGCGLELPGGAGHAAVRLACRAPHPAPRGRTLGRHRRRSLKPVCAFAACPAGRGHPHAQAASRGTLSRPQMPTAATAQPRGAV